MMICGHEWGKPDKHNCLLVNYTADNCVIVIIWEVVRWSSVYCWEFFIIYSCLRLFFQRKKWLIASCSCVTVITMGICIVAGSFKGLLMIKYYGRWFDIKLLILINKFWAVVHRELLAFTQWAWHHGKTLIRWMGILWWFEWGFEPPVNEDLYHLDSTNWILHFPADVGGYENLTLSISKNIGAWV